uniref:UBA domain-containing protein n=2 Tax=Setaria italica TaxID=4555 RepID=K3XXM2_SETIT
MNVVCAWLIIPEHGTWRRVAKFVSVYDRTSEPPPQNGQRSPGRGEPSLIFSHRNHRFPSSLPLSLHRRKRATAGTRDPLIIHRRRPQATRIARELATSAPICFPTRPRDPTRRPRSLSPERLHTLQRDQSVPTDRATRRPMEYDFRGRPGSGSYGAPPGAAAPGGGSSLYPRVGQPTHGGGGGGGGSATASPRAAPYHHGPGAGSGSSAPIVTPLAPTSTSSKVGIQVAIKPEFRITPPPQLPPQMVEIPRSTFNFDFEYERRILAEAEKENPNWSKFVVERQAPPPPVPQQARPASSGSGDPVVDKYVSMGLGREAVSFAVLNYGDNPAKVKEFVKSYNILHEMGFTSPNVPELLAIHDNDPDKVIQRLLSSPS